MSPQAGHELLNFLRSGVAVRPGLFVLLEAVCLDWIFAYLLPFFLLFHGLCAVTVLMTRVFATFMHGTGVLVYVI